MESLDLSPFLAPLLCVAAASLLSVIAALALRRRMDRLADQAAPQAEREEVTTASSRSSTE